MSREIDERIVEMRFDNRQFEAGVQTSLSTLDKLKKGLDLDGAAKGLDQLGTAAKKCDMSTLGRSVETVSAKFSALETIAVGALLKIGSQIATTGERLLKSMTIDQVTAGWSKYADKTTAVQTIMAATGKSIDEVNGSLEKLIWFTDETSYSMTDMTSNIGKFTSQGIDLETAVTAMEGISTWASLSGGSISEASRAMYNLSQALGVGAVKLQDWKSIENANMATKEFKEMAMEAAVATGDLTKSFDAAGNAIYKTSKGTEVTAANFSSTLSDAWFSSEALIGVLNNYGGYADGVYELYNNLADGVDKTTSEIIQDLKNLKGSDDQTILNAGYTQDQIELVRQLSEEVGGVGQKSFAAAQEAKTFSEVLDSVKEAVGSGWAQTFETVFGNYEEAKVLWTDLANELYDVFAESGNARNELLSEALSVSGFDRFTTTVREAGIEMDVFEEKLGEVASNKGLSLEDIISEYGSLEKAVQNGEITYDMLRDATLSCGEAIEGLSLVKLRHDLDNVLGSVDELAGREHLISAFWNTWEGARTLLSTFGDAFRDIFPATTAEQLYTFVEGLDELTTRFKTFLTESEEGQKLLTDLTNTFKGAFAVLDIVVQLVRAFVRTITPAGSAVGGLLSGVLGLTGSFGEWLANLDKVIKENDVFYRGIKAVIDFIKGAISTVSSFAASIGEKMGLPGLDDAKASLQSFLETLKTNIGAPGLEFLHSLFEGLCTRAKQVRDAVIGLKDGIVDSMDRVNGAVSGNKFVQVLGGIGTLIKQVASAISGLLGKALDGLINTLRNADFNVILDFLNALAAGGLIAAVKKFLDPMEEMEHTFTGFISWVKELGGGVTKILDGVCGSLEAWQTKLKSDALGKIAASIAVLSVSLLLLSTIDSGKVTGSLAAMGTMFAELMTSMVVLDELSIDGKAANKTASAMIKMGAALLVLSLAMKNIGELDPEQLAEGLMGVGVLLAEIDLFLYTAKFDKNASKAATGMILFSAAIKILASAVTTLGSMDLDAMAKGLIGVGVLLAEVDVFLNTAKFSGKTLLTATGIVILSSAIKILASVCKDFGSMSVGEIVKGLTSVGVLLAEITAFTKLTGDAKHVISTGLALIEIAAAMKILVSAVADFASMSGAEIAKGLIAMGGALAEVTIAVNAMPKNMVGVGTGLVIVGAALKIVASALSSMGNMSWEEIAKGLVAMGGSLAGLAIGLNLMSGTLGGSAALLVAAGALTVLTPVLVNLGGMSWESIAKGLIAIAGAFAVIGVAGAVLSPLAPTILALSGAVALLGAGAVGIGAGLTLIGTGLTSISMGLVSLAASFASSGTLIVGGLSAIVLGFAGLIPAIAEKIGEAIVAFCGIITNGAPAIGEAVKAIVLTLADVWAECVPVIADVALQLVTAILASLVAYTPQIIDSVMQFLIEILEGIARNLPQLIQAAMDLVGAFFAGVLSALSDIDSDSLIKGVAAVGLLTALVAALGAVSGLISAAMAGVLGLGVVITELAIVFAAIGALAQIPGLEWLISESEQFLQTVGNAIGGFVGGIVGGFMSGVSSSFPQIGADLSSFMANVQPFIDGAKNISPDMLTGVKALTEVIILITAADLLEGLTSWLTGGSSLSNFAEQLVPFGEAMMKFSNTISGLDGDLVSTAAIAGKTLAEMAATLPNSGGVVGFFAGENDMGTFGEQLVGFGESMMNFADTVDGLKTDTIQNAAIAGKVMAEMATTLPNTGGAVSFFTGNNDMDAFGDQLVPFGKAIKEYSDAVDGLKVDAVVNSATAGKALVELADTVPNTGGAVAFFTGDNDLATFGDQIVVFGEAMAQYSATVSGKIDAEAISASTNAGTTLVELAKTLPSTGGLMEWFAGGNSLDKFGKSIVPFGKAMVDYSAAVSGNIDAEAITASVNAGKTLVELSATLPATGGLMEWFSGGNSLDKFGDTIIPFGKAMADYSDAVSNKIDTESIGASAVAGQSLAELSASLPAINGVISWFVGNNDLASFGASIAPFGEAIAQYSAAVSGKVDVAAIAASTTAGQSLVELANTLPSTYGAVAWFNDNDVSAFGSHILAFGETITQYSATVAGNVSPEAVTASVNAGQALVELANTLPKCSGLAEVFTGTNSLASFGDDIVAFGEDLAAYATAIKDVKPEVVTASANAAQALSNLASELPDSSLFDKWFGGDQTLASFGSDIAKFGQSMYDYYSKIVNIELTKLSEVVTQVWFLVDLAKGIQGLNTSGLTSFGNALKTMANTGITEFTSAFSNSTTEVNKAVQSMLNSVSTSISNGKTLTTPGMESVMKSLADVVAKKANEINTSVTTMMNGVATIIRNSSRSIQAAAKTVVSNAVSTLNSMKGEFNTAGQNAGQGFANGINAKLSSATTAGRNLGLAALNAAKKALDSHSPSREFIHLGENMGEGLAIGAKNSIVPASQATSTMIDEVLKVSAKGIEAFQEWAEEKKYYSELSLKDELAGYENLQKMYKAGSEERIKIDREVYRIQNELVASTYQASIDWIEEEKFYNRLSTQEELEAYERMQKRYLEGSEERKKIDREIYTLRNQLVDESYQNSMDWIEEEKYYNRISLADELAAYKRVQSRYVKGTDERKKMDREVYRLEQEIYEAQKQYISDVQKVQTEANQKRLDLEEEYADKVKSINDKLAQDIKSLNDQYENSLNSRANSLYKSYGLFDEVKEREEVSGETLMKNLTDQVKEFGEWQDILDSLSARGLDSELVSELQEMGPSAIAQIKALNSMSDSELETYAALWSIKHAQAREQAVGELEGLRIETQNSIAQLRVEAAQELEDYRTVWQEKMNQVTIDANAELEQLRKDFGEKVGLIKKDTEEETQEMVDTAQAILEEAGWDETGKQIVTGIKKGVEDEKPSFLDALTQMALEGVQAVKDTLDINSPSRVFQELGNYTGLGFVKGLSDYANKSYTAGANVAEYAANGLSNAISDVSDLVNGEFDMQPTIRPVLDFSDVTRGAGELNNMFNNTRALALAGQTSLAFNATMDKGDMTITVDNDGVVQELRSLRSDMVEMTEQIKRMQIVLDTGTLVGEMAEPMDAALGRKMAYRGRGI